jgi:S1-C subfamily serine protease
MRRSFQDQLLVADHLEVECVIEFVDLYHRDRAAFKAACNLMWNEKDREIAGSGFFKAEHVCEVVQKSRGNENWGHKPMIVGMALQRLADWGLVADIRLLLGGKGPEYRIPDEPAATKFWSKSFAEDIIRGPLFSMKKYKRSLPAIIVMTTDGDESVATGFLTYVEKKGVQHPVLITNKHVTQKGTIKKIRKIEADGHPYTWSEVIESERFDLTAIRVAPPEGASGFEPFHAAVLEDVITLGYPKVAVSTAPTLLAHKGEVNGTITSRVDGNTYLAISCAVAPGNSGGPALNEGARVVGVVSMSSIGRYASGSGDELVTEVGVHHLAVPASDLQRFLNEEVWPKL